MKKGLTHYYCLINSGSSKPNADHNFAAIYMCDCEHDRNEHSPLYLPVKMQIGLLYASLLITRQSSGRSVLEKRLLIETNRKSCAIEFRTFFSPLWILACRVIYGNNFPLSPSQVSCSIGYTTAQPGFKTTGSTLPLSEFNLRGNNAGSTKKC